jgi:hypothetical protein
LLFALIGRHITADGADRDTLLLTKETSTLVRTREME